MLIHIYSLVYFISDKKKKTSFLTLYWTFYLYTPQNALLLFKQCFLFTYGDNKSATILPSITSVKRKQHSNTCNGVSVLLICYLKCFGDALLTSLICTSLRRNTLAADGATSTALITTSTFLTKPIIITHNDFKTIISICFAVDLYAHQLSRYAPCTVAMCDCRQHSHVTLCLKYNIRH